MNYEELKEYLKSILEKKNKDYKNYKYLIIGCGNSNLGIDMKKDGFVNVWNIDYSEVVIKKMQEKEKDQKYI